MIINSFVELKLYFGSTKFYYLFSKLILTCADFARNL